MRLSDQQKGIFFALGGILIITPDSLFIRLVETSDCHINILDYFFENLCKIKLAIKTNVRIRWINPKNFKTSEPKINKGIPVKISPKPVKNWVTPFIKDREFLKKVCIN